MKDRVSDNNVKTKVTGSGFKTIIVILAFLFLPIISVKINGYINDDTKKNKNQNINSELVKPLFDKYLNDNSEFVLHTVLKQYYETKIKNSDDRINNAVWLLEKDLFADDLPSILLGSSSNSNSLNNSESDIELDIDQKQSIEPVKVLMLFSDFDLAKDIFDKINEIRLANTTSKSPVRIYFRQIITQNPNSAIIARYTYAINKINSKYFIPSYMSILSKERRDLKIEDIEQMIKGFGLEYNDVKAIADSKESEDMVKRTNSLTASMRIDHLPAFIMQNGRIVFNTSGLKVITNILESDHNKS